MAPTVKFNVSLQDLTAFDAEYDGSREWYILKQKTYGQAFCDKFRVTGPQSNMIESVTDSRVGRDIVRRWVDIYGT